MLDPLPFISRRSVVYGTHGMVASSQPLATQAGIQILQSGGNAAHHLYFSYSPFLVDTEPAATGIGGDAACLFYNAKTQKVVALNGTGRSPAALTLDYFKSHCKGSSIPETSIHAVTVPGAAAAWVDLVDHFGSGKLDMSAILQPAIGLAENGFPVSHFGSRLWNKAAKGLKEKNGNKNDFLFDGVRAPFEGEIMRLPDLANTFKTVAAEGKDGFYKGRIGDSIVQAIRSRGGLMTHEDLASHTSDVIEPISLDYHGWTVWEIPPNSQGITALIAIGIIRALEEEHGLDLSKLGHNSAEYLHVVIEALRLAFADTRCCVTDPQVLSVPTEKLLSREYLSKRAKLVDMKKRNSKIVQGYPDHKKDTVYFSVVDKEGNACSFLNSNFDHFGSHIIPDRCGFTLHNRGCNFMVDKNHPNCIGPKKRPYHTIIPSMITRKTPSGGHELEACFGVVGGYMQPQGHVQIIMNMLHFLTNPQHLVDLPRICIAPPEDDGAPSETNVFTNMNDSAVYVEDGISPKAIEQLEAMGHTCYVVNGYRRTMFGRCQIIRAKKDTRTGQVVLAGGSDPRGDGQTVGLSSFGVAKL
ncbi:gamma-glutamyltranspeptidase [Zychaea mexicana]|uniref:gamma-glutamyltranspeptidase n=1 Tax=Zychaea mexicana TaxID=64656 RepID=UPI0022FE2C0C|nr:gamma-glutamyltranspeptidase [Zychaea mexicana]KAI9492926.1 gamma-glutamyltranspeptidase [Zychaea mexicana]